LDLKIALPFTHPQVYRIVRAREDATFEALHTVLQCVFGWLDRSLHEFRVSTAHEAVRIGPIEELELDLEMETEQLHATVPDGASVPVRRLDEVITTLGNVLDPLMHSSRQDLPFCEIVYLYNPDLAEPQTHRGDHTWFHDIKIERVLQVPATVPIGILRQWNITQEMLLSYQIEQGKDPTGSHDAQEVSELPLAVCVGGAHAAPPEDLDPKTFSEFQRVMNLREPTDPTRIQLEAWYWEKYLEDWNEEFALEEVETALETSLYQ
jgi:hypothetical protein